MNKNIKAGLSLLLCITGLCFSAAAQLSPITGIGEVNGVQIGPGVTIVNKDLSYEDLRGASLQGASLTDVLLTGANLSNTIYRTADLSYAVLEDVYLTDADLINADLNHADLINVNISGADFTGADFDYIRATNVIVGGVSPVLPSGWGVHNGYLIGSTANLTGANLSNADLNGVDLSGATLTGVSSGNISGTPTALPSGWILTNGYLIGSSADLHHAVLTNCNFSGFDLSGCDLSDANFSNSDLSDADLRYADLTGTIFTGADLTGADVESTWLDFQSKSDLQAVSNLTVQLENEYTLEEIADLRSGSSMIAVSNGFAEVALVLETSTNLTDWVTVSNTPVMNVPADTQTKFFRYRED